MGRRRPQSQMSEPIAAPAFGFGFGFAFPFIFAFALTLLGTLVLCWFYLRLATARRWVRPVTARDLHIRPTVSGGGVGAALAIGAGLLALPALGVPLPSPGATLGLVAVLAIIGFIDDHRPLPSTLKLLLQAGGIALFWQLQPAGVQFDAISGLALVALLFVGQLWWINLVNFMDGADGFAPTQIALGVIGVGLGLLLLPAPATAAAGEPLSLAALVLGAALGVLAFTRPRARMFMGDCGALVLAGLVLVLAAEARDVGLALAQVSVFFSLFIADASITLLSRTISGRNPFEAHRDHGYQRFILRSQTRALRQGLEPEAARTRAHWRALLWLVALNAAVVIPLGLVAIALDHASAAIAVHLLVFIGVGLVRFGFQRAH